MFVWLSAVFGPEVKSVPPLDLCWGRDSLHHWIDGKVNTHTVRDR